jgi:hypothetical protein
MAWTLDMTVSAHTVTATATATATAAGTAGATTPTTIVIISGSGQVGRSETARESPLVVDVRDGLGHPLPNISVIFTQAAGNSDGFISPSPDVTGADGRLSVT